MNYKTTVTYAPRASTVDILLKTILAVRPLPELEIEQDLSLIHIYKEIQESNFLFV